VVVGAAIFVIWWITTPAFAPRSILDSELRRGKPAEQPAIPRGGTLTGSLSGSDEGEAIDLLTQATLVRVNRSTDRVEPWLAESWSASAPPSSPGSELQ